MRHHCVFIIYEKSIQSGQQQWFLCSNLSLLTSRTSAKEIVILFVREKYRHRNGLDYRFISSFCHRSLIVMIFPGTLWSQTETLPGHILIKTSFLTQHCRGATLCLISWTSAPCHSSSAATTALLFIWRQQPLAPSLLLYLFSDTHVDPGQSVFTLFPALEGRTCLSSAVYGWKSFTYILGSPKPSPQPIPK